MQTKMTRRRFIAVSGAAVAVFALPSVSLPAPGPATDGPAERADPHRFQAFAQGHFGLPAIRRARMAAHG